MSCNECLEGKCRGAMSQPYQSQNQTYGPEEDEEEKRYNQGLI